jgi:hypothetical protein
MIRPVTPLPEPSAPTLPQISGIIATHREHLAPVVMAAMARTSGQQVNPHAPDFTQAISAIPSLADALIEAGYGETVRADAFSVPQRVEMLGRVARLMMEAYEPSALLMTATLATLGGGFSVAASGGRH